MKIDEKGLKSNKLRENVEVIAKFWFFANAFIAVLAVVAIAFFIFYRGTQPFFTTNANGHYPFWDFISGLVWNHSDNLDIARYGVLYMIFGSVFATIGAIIIGVPIAILTAVFIAEIAPKSVRRIVKPAVELLAGIPSILYGVFGLGVIVPAIMNTSPRAQGQSLLAVIIVLTIMILPTIVTITENAIRTVPDAYREGSYGLGASKIQTIFKVILPAARSGILTGVVLGIGRAIGETMAVILVAGNPQGGIPTSLWDPVRPLTTNIALEMSYAFGLHQEMLFATGVILFSFIVVINLILVKVTSKMGRY